MEVHFRAREKSGQCHGLKHELLIRYWSTHLIYFYNTNISFFHSADEFEIVRQQRTQFTLIFARISEEFLTSGFEFGKRFEAQAASLWAQPRPARKARVRGLFPDMHGAVTALVPAKQRAGGVAGHLFSDL